MASKQQFRGPGETLPDGLPDWVWEVDPTLFALEGFATGDNSLLDRRGGVNSLETFGSSFETTLDEIVRFVNYGDASKVLPQVLRAWDDWSAQDLEEFQAERYHAFSRTLQDPLDDPIYALAEVAKSLKTGPINPRAIEGMRRTKVLNETATDYVKQYYQTEIEAEEIDRSPLAYGAARGYSAGSQETGVRSYTARGAGTDVGTLSRAGLNTALSNYLWGDPKEGGVWGRGDVDQPSKRGTLGTGIQPFSVDDAPSREATKEDVIGAQLDVMGWQAPDLEEGQEPPVATITGAPWGVDATSAYSERFTARGRQPNVGRLKKWDWEVWTPQSCADEINAYRTAGADVEAALDHALGQPDGLAGFEKKAAAVSSFGGGGISYAAESLEKQKQEFVQKRNRIVSNPCEFLRTIRPDAFGEGASGRGLGGGGGGTGRVYSAPDRDEIRDYIRLLAQTLIADNSTKEELEGWVDQYLKTSRYNFDNPSKQRNPQQEVKETLRKTGAYGRLHKYRPSHVAEEQWLQLYQTGLRQGGLNEGAIGEVAQTLADDGRDFAYVREHAQLQQAARGGRAPLLEERIREGSNVIGNLF